MYVCGFVYDYRYHPSITVAEETIRVEDVKEADKVADSLYEVFKAKFKDIPHGKCIVLTNNPYEACRYPKKIYVDCM